MSPDRFKYLAAFLQTASRGSFTAAADALELTPAAVSKNVAALEQALNVRLFNRTTRSLNLTDEGRMFFAQAQLPVYLIWQNLLDGSLKTVLNDIHLPQPYELSIQYPHRTMLASRVRVVRDFLLETMKNHAGLQASRADLLTFAAPLR